MRSRRRGWKGRTGANAQSRLIPPDQENPLGPCTSSASCRSGPETREWHYGQRQIKGRTYRSDTWPHQPADAKGSKNPFPTESRPYTAPNPTVSTRPHSGCLFAWISQLSANLSGFLKKLGYAARSQRAPLCPVLDPDHRRPANAWSISKNTRIWLSLLVCGYLTRSSRMLQPAERQSLLALFGELQYTESFDIFPAYTISPTCATATFSGLL